MTYRRATRIVMLALTLFASMVSLQAQEAQPVPTAPNIEALKQERQAILKTVEAAQLKVQLHQTQLSLVQLMLQQAEAETQAAKAAQHAFEARVREALGAKDGDEVDWDAMTLKKKAPEKKSGGGEGA